MDKSLNKSDYDLIPCAQKCACCHKYLMQGQRTMKDPRYRYWYSHVNCVKVLKKKTVE